MLRRILLAALLVLAGPALAQTPPAGSQVYTPDNSTSATVAALNAYVGPLQLSGEVGAALIIPASSTLVATLTPYCSGDNATWTSTSFYPDATGTTVATLTTVSGTAYQYGVVLLSACKYVRVMATSYTSGTVSATLTANQIAVIGSGIQIRKVQSTLKQGTPVTVGTSPTLVTSGLRADRVIQCFRNNSSVMMYFGDSAVTIDDGFPLDAGATFCDDSSSSVYMVVATGTGELRRADN